MVLRDRQSQETDLKVQRETFNKVKPDLKVMTETFPKDMIETVMKKTLRRMMSELT